VGCEGGGGGKFGCVGGGGGELLSLEAGILFPWNVVAHPQGVV